MFYIFCLKYTITSSDIASILVVGSKGGLQNADCEQPVLFKKLFLQFSPGLFYQKLPEQIFVDAVNMNLVDQQSDVQGNEEYSTCEFE